MVTTREFIRVSVWIPRSVVQKLFRPVMDRRFILHIRFTVSTTDTLLITNMTTLGSHPVYRYSPFSTVTEVTRYNTSDDRPTPLNPKGPVRLIDSD